MNKQEIIKVLDEVIDLQTNHTDLDLMAFDKILNLREKLKKSLGG